MQYKIVGENMPVVICSLGEGESLFTEKGAMKWMSPNMNMQTTAGGSIGKAFGRMFTGESIFQNIYTAEHGPGMIALGGNVPGSIRAVQITPDRPIIAQKSAFLAAQPGVELSVFFQKKFATGFLGGEGFLMQKLSGQGIAFLEIDGSTVEYELKQGQQLVVDTGHLALLDASCTIEVQTVQGAKNKLFGGEGFFNTVITGPGRVVLQTMPLSALAADIAALIPSS